MKGSPVDEDGKRQDDPAQSATRARLAASLRMLGLALGVVIGMVAGVALDSIVLGAALGIGVGVAAATLLERVMRPRGS